MRLAILAAVLLLASPSPSHACRKRHQSMFELFDTAATVAYVKVRTVPAPSRTSRSPDAGPAELAVTRTVKGAKKSTLLAAENNTSCHIGFRAGRSALVFLDARGNAVGRYEGYVETFAPWKDTIDLWAAAGTDTAQRLTVLVDAITTATEAIARDAAYFLVDQPELLTQLDADQTSRLAAAIPTAKHSMLPMVLARLRDAAGTASADPSTAAMLAVTGFEAVTDPARLADAIDAGTGASDPDRIAAFERCERVHARQLWPFTSYHSGVAAHIWAKLAAACRTGVRVTL